MAMIDVNYESLQYDKYGDELAELGVSENDAYMYVTWQFADESVATPELMNSIASLSSGSRFDVEMLKAWAANFYSDVFVFNPVVITIFALMGFLFILSRPFSAGWLYCLGESALFAVMSVYYQYSGRWTHRLVYSALLLMLVVTVTVPVFNDRDYFKRNGQGSSLYGCSIDTVFKTLLPILCVMAVASRMGNEFEYREYQRDEQNFSVLQMYMEEEKDTLFVADTFTCGTRYKYDIFTPVKKGALDNYVTTGSWNTASPIEHDIVKKYGYSDPFDALKSGSDNVILIDNNCPERKAQYFTEHGDGPRYAAEYIETVSGYNLYRIR